jgi:hypothetical protein
VAVEITNQSKRLHTRAVPAGILSFALAVGLAGCLYTFPDFTATAAKALVSQAVHIETNKNGTADISFGAEKPTHSEGLGSASGAGERMNMQLNLQTAADTNN